LHAFNSKEVSNRVELWIISKNAKPDHIAEFNSHALDTTKNIKIFNDLVGVNVSKTLAMTDLCVVPSRCREVASRVVLEAHAQGVPVIASSTVGNNYLVKDGFNGKIFPCGDVNALRKCFLDISSYPKVHSYWSRNLPKPVDKSQWISKIIQIFSEMA
jgi:glycosyltransferase involved in cell wall biosynthesis